MGTYTYRFQEIQVGGSTFEYVCAGCKKKRTRTVKRSYYRNGFHNEELTREKYYKEIEVEKFILFSGLGVCKSCKEDGVKEPKTAEVPDGWKWPVPPPTPQKWRGPRKYLDVQLNRAFVCLTQEEYDRTVNGRLVDPETGKPLLQIPYNPDIATISATELWTRLGKFEAADSSTEVA